MTFGNVYEVAFEQPKQGLGMATSYYAPMKVIALSVAEAAKKAQEDYMNPQIVSVKLVMSGVSY